MVTHPILFGDFIKVGADKEDKIYEDLTNIDKVKQVLGDVRFFNSFLFAITAVMEQYPKLSRVCDFTIKITLSFYKFIYIIRR